jgi:serine/threonine protein kinase
MQPDDQVAEWLVRWEEAREANQTPPALDQLPAELRPRAREGLRLLRGFSRMSLGLTTTARTAPGNAPPVPPDTPRYRFEAFLARGGMAEVWRGCDKVLAREVALKVLREGVFADSRFRVRFEEEARLVGQLQHPSIVPVYDLGELPDGRPFFVMKLIHGPTLAELLAARATPADDLARWVGVFEQVCVAVAFAHARDLIHRDLKPSNVMLGEFGEVLVMDWGIAKALADRPQPLPPTPVLLSPAVGEASTALGAAETLPGQAKGTPAFMAPEQARGDVGRVGKTSDVFGLGGILCVTLTGQPPYTRAEQVFAADVTEAFARLDGCGADAELVGLAKACLAPAPEARPADAAEVAGRVKRYRDEVAARQAQAERVLWLCHGTREGGAAVPPAADAARTQLRQQAWALLRAEVTAQARRLSGASPAEATAARQVLEVLRELPSWPASATRQRWPTSPSPSARCGRRSGRKSRGCCAARSRHDNRLFGDGGQPFPSRTSPVSTFYFRHLRPPDASAATALRRVPSRSARPRWTPARPTARRGWPASGTPPRCGSPARPRSACAGPGLRP